MMKAVGVGYKQYRHGGNGVQATWEWGTGSTGKGGVGVEIFVLFSA